MELNAEQIAKEKRKEQRRRYYLKHRDAERARQARYHQAHKDDPEYIAKRQAYHKEWQRANKDKVSAYKRAHKQNSCERQVR